MQNKKTPPQLHNAVRELIIEAKTVVRRSINFVTVVQNWEIGRLIVEDEQDGDKKAEYGKYVIKELSAKLTSEFGNGYNEQNLRFFRQFYNVFPIRYAVRSELQSHDNQESDKSVALRHQSKNPIRYALRGKSHPLFEIISPQLSWTHYRSLLKVENPKAREFYIKEAAENDWGTRALDRQINTLYYERLLSSQEKQPVIDEMKELFAAKYKLYLPTEKELKGTIELQKPRLEFRFL